MKTLNYLLTLMIIAFTLSSCANLQQVSDDDIYLTKSPKLAAGEEINDVTSYENFKYNANNKTYNSRYGFGGTHQTKVSQYYSYHGAFGIGRNQYYDPFYYRNGYYYDQGFFYAFNPNFYPYGYPTCGQFGYNVYFYHNNYPYGYNYNYYNNYGYYTNTAYYSNFNTNNYHYGSRSSIAGVNNSNRRMYAQTVGLKKNDNLSARNQKNNFSTGARNSGASNGSITSRNVKNTREISAGTGLSRDNTTVRTSSVNRNNNSTSSRSGENTSGTRTSNPRVETSGTNSSRSSSGGGASGTTRNSGSSGTSSSPRNGGSASPSPTRRGGR